jgi:hypothetical protein
MMVSHSRSPSSRWYHRLWHVKKTATPLRAMQLGIVECMLSHWDNQSSAVTPSALVRQKNRHTSESDAIPVQATP